MAKKKATPADLPSKAAVVREIITSGIDKPADILAEAVKRGRSDITIGDINNAKAKLKKEGGATKKGKAIDLATVTKVAELVNLVGAEAVREAVKLVETIKGKK